MNIHDIEGFFVALWNAQRPGWTLQCVVVMMGEASLHQAYLEHFRQISAENSRLLG
jgi:hypothetical protein